ncbi:MAG: extracellular solute-binding protein [Pseudomonadota bacterium]
MDVIDQLNAVREKKLSRRAFSRGLLAAGVGITSLPYMPRRAHAADGQGTLFTWGGYDVPDLYTNYEAANGAQPNFAIFGGSEDALTRMRSGFVVDVAHPCNADLLRWIDTGLFQPVDTSRLSNWGDVMPELVAMEGNSDDDGNPWLVPFDWGGTSVTYRTDLVELEGEESWDLLWDKRFAGQIGMLASGGDAWWSAAIKAGVPFDQITTDDAFERIAAVLREQRPLVRVYTDDTTTLGQALASGEMVAAMTWNSTAVELQYEEIPVRFAQPKEGALTWVCGLMVQKNAPNIDRAYEIIDAMLSVEAGEFMIGAYGYGHSNKKSFEQFSDEDLQALGLSSNPQEILDAGHFMIPQGQEWESRMNETYELIKAGF